MALEISLSAFEIYIQWNTYSTKVNWNAKFVKYLKFFNVFSLTHWKYFIRSNSFLASIRFYKSRYTV